MYPRTKTVQGRTYLQIVESYREGPKTQQRVIATLGRLDKLREKGEVDNLLVGLARFADQETVSSEYEKGNLSAGSVVHTGPDPRSPSSSSTPPASTSRGPVEKSSGPEDTQRTGGQTRTRWWLGW